MTLDITVRGSAEQHHRAERATVSLAISIDGPDKQQVFADAVEIQEPLTAQLKELADLHAVTAWSSDQVRIFGHRPWTGDAAPGGVTHVAKLHVRAEFADFERLSGFIDTWSSVEGVEVAEIAWDISGENRRLRESEVRTSAVENAVVKAQGYADALRRGKVAAVHIADRGMLADSGDGSPVPFAAATFSRADGSGPGLDLTPEQIVIRVEVDARFRAV